MSFLIGLQLPSRLSALMIGAGFNQKVSFLVGLPQLMIDVSFHQNLEQVSFLLMIGAVFARVWRR